MLGTCNTSGKDATTEAGRNMSWQDEKRGDENEKRVKNPNILKGEKGAEGKRGAKPDHRGVDVSKYN